MLIGQLAGGAPFRVERRRGDDIATTQALPHVDRQAFPREQIEHRQCAEASSIGDEIHTPNVVASDRWSSLLPMDGGGMSSRTLPSERQALLAYRAIASLLPELPALASQEHEQSTIPKSHACLCSSRIRCRSAVRGLRQL
jgi:hypothetical protein